MYRFGQVAAAIGMNEGQFRNWLTRDRIVLSGHRTSGGWRTFTERDVMVLALAAELVRFGARVFEAVKAVSSAVDNGGLMAMAAPYAQWWAAPDLKGGWLLDESAPFVFVHSGGSTMLCVPTGDVLEAVMLRLRGKAARFDHPGVPSDEPPLGWEGGDGRASGPATLARLFEGAALARLHAALSAKLAQEQEGLDGSSISSQTVEGETDSSPAHAGDKKPPRHLGS